jgi:hypothetical protein
MTDRVRSAIPLRTRPTICRFGAPVGRAGERARNSPFNGTCKAQTGSVAATMYFRRAVIIDYRRHRGTNVANDETIPWASKARRTAALSRRSSSIHDQGTPDFMIIDQTTSVGDDHGRPSLLPRSLRRESIAAIGRHRPRRAGMRS